MPVRLKWTDPKVAAHEFWKACVTDALDNTFFTYTEATAAFLSTMVAIGYALYMLAYPPRHRLLSMLLLLVPLTYSFLFGQNVLPSFTLCDTFTRFLYIWYAAVSYYVTIVQWSPPGATTHEHEHDNKAAAAPPPPPWQSRLKAAYKVLFAYQDRSPHEIRNTHARGSFVAYHACKALGLYMAQNAYYIFSWHYLSRAHVFGAEKAVFFRRLPHSFNADEVVAALDSVMHWCVINLWLYEALHSCFAALFVALHLDEPHEWGMSLFGSVAEAYTVRRYWGKHWHGYIYMTFSGHVKVLTRTWLGMRRSLFTRLVENTLVFAASGLLHSLVRYVQDPQSEDYMVITLWYLGQMGSIVLEDLVIAMWQSGKERAGVKDGVWLPRAERAIGYAWVLAFNMWSITKYTHTRNAWADEARQKRFKVDMEWYNRTHGAEAAQKVAAQVAKDKVEL
ncbi:hypothetical protein ACEQ8H_001696 [Pleosporales sp. CAS-2024a]